MEYKVLTQQDRRRTGKFSPENLERTLNSYAAEGWRVVSSIPVASPWTISTSQIMLLLEREGLASDDECRARPRGVVIWSEDGAVSWPQAHVREPPDRALSAGCATLVSDNSRIEGVRHGLAATAG